jgi:hypothetical protein
MIYLIKLISGNDLKTAEEIYKIGFTKKPEQRLRSYQAGNPGAEYEIILRGTEKTERCLHEYFKEYRYVLRNEYYRCCPEIKDNFREITETINTYLRRGSRKLEKLSLQDILRLLKIFPESIELYDTLLEKYPSEVETFKYRLSVATNFDSKIRLVCSEYDRRGMENIPPEWSDYIKILGTPWILGSERTLGKRLLDKEVAKKREEVENREAIIKSLQESFRVGEIYTSAEVKDKIKSIYGSLGIEPRNKCNYLAPTMKLCFRTVKSSVIEGGNLVHVYKFYPLTTPDALNSDMNIKTI